MGLLDDSGDPCFLEGAAREGHSSGEEEEEEEGHLDDHDKTSHGEMDVDYNGVLIASCAANAYYSYGCLTDRVFSY